MIKFYKYTDKELTEILNSIVILTDTREKCQNHILDWFDKKKIAHKKMKLPFGDYSFYLPKNEKYGITRDLYFYKDISIERKGSLEELAGNFAQQRDRIEKEFSLYKGKMTLLIENGTYKDVALGNYNTKYNSKSYVSTLHSFSHRYNFDFIFLEDNIPTGHFIYNNFKCYLRNLIK